MIEERPLAHAAWLRARASRRVLDALEGDGTEVRFVGGCVRDTLLDPTLDIVDLDLATVATPERNLELLADAGIKTFPTGLAHGTITAHTGSRSFEITTLRRDVATDGRRAVVTYTDCFTADAARRDLTINTLSCDRFGRVFDTFGGRADLAAGIVRFVGEPTARIREDYLRILRFFRFQARFGRVPPDTATLAALAAERAGLDLLSGERVRSEVLRLLMAPGVLAALELMRSCGVWRQVFAGEPALEDLRRLLDLAPDATAILRLACLLRDRSDPAAVAARLRLSNAERERLAQAMSGELPGIDAGPVTLRRLAYRLGTEGADDRLVVAAARTAVAPDTVAEARRIVRDFGRRSLPVGGKDLLARGMAPGPGLGARLRELEDAWIASDFKLDREMLLKQLGGGDH
ncbi:MAG: CCA tRNA nucleotidyltransferase [Geminicoccaceae bacterium]|nr:CCA tRNA nucleotidyltransferase [Geminicoccaceae bacterium]MCB9966546.1 CCA tRNA nucleotidyltransferase [Geminicoccaceae bacterium]HRY24440.1 CCA tRNA nucleotidyltransferase [Geminicoccaceae bacterium]